MRVTYVCALQSIIFTRRTAVHALADPELQKRGAKFLPKIFFTTDLFLGISRKNFCISPNNFIYLPKFLTTFFLVIDYFSCFNMLVFHRGSQIRSPHQLGGAKILKFTQIHNSTIGGQTPLPTSMGAMAGFAPPCVHGFKGFARYTRVCVIVVKIR